VKGRVIGGVSQPHCSQLSEGRTPNDGLEITVVKPPHKYIPSLSILFALDSLDPTKYKTSTRFLFLNHQHSFTMAKKGASKKVEQTKKKKVIEDKTFGLKNKNKSQKVKELIQAVTKNVMNSGDPKQRKLDEQRKRMMAEKKMMKKAAIDERNTLFGEALLAVKKKTTFKTKGESESKGRDHNDTKEKTGQSRAMKM